MSGYPPELSVKANGQSPLAQHRRAKVVSDASRRPARRNRTAGLATLRHHPRRQELRALGFSSSEILYQRDKEAIASPPSVKSTLVTLTSTANADPTKLCDQRTDKALVMGGKHC
jgi:hypothetical protein